MKNRPFKSTSQSNQDYFAYTIGGATGTYIEVGACKPKSKSNTYNLEKLGWKGFSIEINTSFQSEWEASDRTNKIFWEDAIKFDYTQALKKLKLPKHITYLSCDIEPPNNTFSALKNIIESGITFDCITFEHDKYQFHEDYDIIARNFLKNYGYKVAVENVFVNVHKEKVFETWFISESTEFQTMNYKDWLKAHCND